ncbi:terpene cyclase/mutase family protein [Streptomyces sp. JJ66]|uniref:prenyltransferase/squalene oxidase repeat-containing protein n=1 Tax=Streptomyces sp. JJ66 TaxID=2803843 RepID=UPI001C56381B|nr:prenyltransferase/squalene oxidase repeat-containing protein [Streptomyces sp. JJ66]MBW1603467.1 terpene cyclase/mutase family protein [Streptomyces sp. JJ66]
MFLRRCAVALAASTVLCASAAPLALADDSPSPTPGASLPEELYGTADPQYDGVFRHAHALLAQDAVGVTPAEAAVSWLTGQQCDDGAFTAYRPDPGQACDDTTVRDTNATALAVQALAAVAGEDDEPVGEAVQWLQSVRNDDGGWGYNPGGASDANSTAVVMGALLAAGEKPQAATHDALRGFQLGCEAPEEERGAFAYQPGEDGKLAPNALATAAAALAAQESGLAVAADSAGDAAPELPACTDGDAFAREDAAQAGAAYLHTQLAAHDGHLMSALPGAEDQPDYGTTTLAVLTLAGGGYDVEQPLAWLAEHHTEWPGVQESPAALAQLVLAVRAAGGDPTAFGGTDLVAQLAATGPAPQEGEPQEQEKEGAGDGSEDGFDAALWIGVAAAIGGALFATGVFARRKNSGSGDTADSANPASGTGSDH